MSMTIALGPAAGRARDAGVPPRGRVLANVVIFEAAWFAVVLGAAHGRSAWGLVAIAMALAWHLAVSARPRAELALAGSLALLGLVVESAVAAQGHVVYTSGQPVRWLAPPWMVALWAEFAMAPNVTLRWLKGRPWTAAVLGAVAGPLSFAGGVRLGAARFVDAVPALVTLACVWAALLPLVMALSDRFDGVTRGGRDA